MPTSKPTSMRFAVSLPNAGDPRRFVQLAAELERSGWDGFFLWDHVQISAAMRPNVVDPWTVLGAAATATERLVLGTLVTPVPRRRPWKLAREVTTLDHLSAGRVVLGVGVGAPAEDDFGAFGEPESVGERAAMLDEALPLLDRFLRGERVEHDGRHYRAHAHLAPAAWQRPRPPIWVGTHLDNRPGIERARRWDGIAPQVWPGLSPEQVQRLSVTLDRTAGYDIAVPVGFPGAAPAAELAAAGATWGIAGMRRPQEPWEEVRSRLLAGPPR